MSRPIAAGIVCSAKRGSHAYNLVTEHTTDVDHLIIDVLPEKAYIGLGDSDQVKESNDGITDIVTYDIRKATRLMLQGNPNALEVLWQPDHLFDIKTLAFQKYIKHRNWFLGKHIYDRYIGYAKSQMSRLGKEDAPTGRLGEKRKNLIEQYGYNTKAAMHLIRLLWQGIDLLSTGTMAVFFEGDMRQKLLDIKTGRWTLAEVKECAETCLEQAKAASEHSVLDDSPCSELVENELLIPTIKGLLWP